MGQGQIKVGRELQGLELFLGCDVELGLCQPHGLPISLSGELFELLRRKQLRATEHALVDQ